MIWIGTFGRVFGSFHHHDYTSGIIMMHIINVNSSFIIIRATLSDVPFSMTAKCKLPIDWCTFSCSFLIAILFSLSLLCHKSGRVLFNGMIFFFVELNSYKSYISLSSEQHDLNWCTESPEERSHTWASWRHTWCPHFHPP